jgi:hypothetical protein
MECLNGTAPVMDVATGEAQTTAEEQVKGNSGSRLEDLPSFGHSGSTPFLTLYKTIT